MQYSEQIALAEGGLYKRRIAMKVLYLFLIALLIVGCRPSAEQMTATSYAARA